jgi:hypothetical protein
MNSELTIIRKLLENFLGMNTSNELSEITRIRLLIEHLVSGSGAAFLPITVNMGSGAPLTFGMMDISSPDDFFGFNNYLGYMGFNELSGWSMIETSLNGDAWGINVNKSGDVTILSDSFSNNFSSQINVFEDRINFSGLNSINIFQIDTSTPSIGFFNTTPAPQQSISNTQYLLLGPPEKSLADALIAYGLLSITP